MTKRRRKGENEESNNESILFEETLLNVKGREGKKTHTRGCREEVDAVIGQARIDEVMS